MGGRNTLGFRPSQPCTPTLIPAPSSTTFDERVQTVDTLMVSQQLITNRMLGSSLTLTGSGSQRPTYEAALCVKAGAQFDGLTEHGLLRVRGQSCMRGPLAVSNIYGPVTVGADPDAGVPEYVQLVVAGGSQTESLVSGEVETTVLTATTAQIEALNATLLTVDGVLAGPFASAEITALVSNAVGIATINIPGSYRFTAVAVSPSLFLVAVTSAVTEAIGDHTSGHSVYLPRYLGAATFAPATVVNYMPAANLVLLQISGITTSIFFDPAVDFAGDIEDSPLPNTPMVIAYGNSATGIMGFTSASVEDGFGQLFSEFTGIHVRAASALPDGALGAPIINHRGRLAALVQYGTPEAGAAYNYQEVYGKVTGGIKARYLRYFLEQAGQPSPANPVPLPRLSTTVLPASSLITGPIRFTERTVTSALLSGGVSLNPGSTTKAFQALNVQLDGTDFAQVLGSFGVNFPNLPEILLTTHAVVAVPTYTITNAVAGAPLTSSSSYTTDVSYWNNGTPNGFSALPESLFSTSMIYVAYGAGRLALTTVPLQLNGLMDNTAGNFAVSTFGTSSDTQIHSGLVVAWGKLGALDTYFDGIGGLVPGLSNTIKSAWEAFSQSVSSDEVNPAGNVFAIGGAKSGSFVFEDALTYLAPNATFANILVTASAGNLQVTVASTTPPLLNFDYSALFNIFDFTASSSAYSLTGSSAFGYTAAGTITYTTAGSSFAVPTPLYVD